jgi:hypothetical protein
MVTSIARRERPHDPGISPWMSNNERPSRGDLSQMLSDSGDRRLVAELSRMATGSDRP